MYFSLPFLFHYYRAPYFLARYDTYLLVPCRRIAAPKGKGRAAIAVAHSIMTIVYHLLTRKQVYQDLGVDYFEVR